MLDFLGAREVRVEEVVKGHADDPRIVKLAEMYRLEDEAGYIEPERDALEAEIVAEYGEDFFDRCDYHETQFSQYTLPGGENYRELLLTLPMMRGDVEVSGPESIPPRILTKRTFSCTSASTNARTSTASASYFSKKSRAIGIRTAGGRGIGKESQRQSPTKIMQRIKVSRPKRRGILNIETTQATPHGERWRNGWRRKTEKGSSVWHAKVPNAPFKTSWPELALKRMLRWGAEHGFDRIGWTTGGQQAQRYDYEAGEGMYRFYDKMLPAVANKYGKKWGVKAGQTSMDTGPSPYRLHYENGLWQVYEGDQSVGHPIGAREDADEFLHDLAREGLGGTVEVHSLDITPALRDSVMQGQPLFLAFGSVPPGKGEIVERQGAPMENQDRAGRNAQESHPGASTPGGPLARQGARSDSSGASGCQHIRRVGHGSL